ncbi:hypothetical protein Y694_03518 [Methylibium sp. T29-B]|uniref:hypothetical protein n=1 Tax=Methylibium sp. T29-B TaxID=1437443 RepID=UPI0003F3FF0F|nr:hypothetical protein [Methylibium sp. T29-B]EWS58604.1 hypothetical protein Y694_03518 [Methylibium sp. T29-B]
MTPWHRFWFPDGDSVPSPTRDAALWTPQALAESQRVLWQQAAEATEAWWRYWRLAWPALPGVVPARPVVPPSPLSAMPMRVASTSATPQGRSVARKRPATPTPTRPDRVGPHAASDRRRQPPATAQARSSQVGLKPMSAGLPLRARAPL